MAYEGPRGSRASMTRHSPKIALTEPLTEVWALFPRISCSAGHFRREMRMRCSLARNRRVEWAELLNRLRRALPFSGVPHGIY